MPDLVPLRRALLSVSDKAGIVELGQALASRDVELVSTGGTARALREAGLEVKDVSDLTAFPEMMDGRVKTLHPVVHGGLLAVRDEPDHAAAMEEHGIGAIDLVVVNLYPFEATVAKGAGYDEVIENIDIGGPAMLRSAAKNHAYVCVVTDVQDYEPLLDQLEKHDGATGYAFRQELALNTYARTAAYDAAVSGWMAGALGTRARRYAVAGELRQEMRYGENPHQAAAFYVDGSARVGVATAIQHQGKALSYNNINDTDAAFELVSEFDPAEGPACAIIKHANPCGVARGASLKEAYQRAFQCDQTSAFGGIIALNQALDGETAEEIAQIFTEVVIAPGADAAAREVFAAKKNLRLLTTDALADTRTASAYVKQVAGGFLLQDKDVGHVGKDDLKVVTERAPTEAELNDLTFAWVVAKHVKSNAIVYASGLATVGVGAGQMSRVDSTRIAARKAEDMADVLGLAEPLTRGSVAASDAFFPFPDGLLTVAEAGATAVIQPGGSMRDDEVIAAANEAGLAMVFTGQRHFRH
ncbi:MAG: bifunctional phosphoribosylaminoimidazolecarboxamide formyltransferase/IMP cyclohydrolase [Pseudomonadota bacterium]